MARFVDKLGTKIIMFSLIGIRIVLKKREANCKHVLS